MGTAERKERDRQEMRRLILETARRMFLEEGFEKVTIRRIADAIEYSVGTLYLYFRDKDEILYALHCEGFEELYHRQQRVLAIADPLERLRAHIHIYLSFAFEQPETYDLMFIMRSPAKKIQHEQSWGVGLRSYRALEENVRECLEARVLRQASLELVTFTLWSQAHGAASLIIRARSVIVSQENITKLAEETVDCVLRGLAT
jgi:AcrR family transcriptional regulator